MTLLAQLRASAAGSLGASGAHGYGVSAAQVDAVYSGLTSQAVTARDALAVSNITSDWADALNNSEPKGSFAPASHTEGYFTTAAFADLWYRARFMAQRGWVQPEEYREAPLTVLSPAHVEAGLVTLTPEQRAEYDAALASGVGVRPDGSVGLSFSLAPASAPPVNTNLPAAPLGGGDAPLSSVAPSDSSVVQLVTVDPTDSGSSSAGGSSSAAPATGSSSTAAPAPSGASDRRPLWIGLGALVLLFLVLGDD
jgi:hypothetical protein